MTRPFLRGDAIPGCGYDFVVSPALGDLLDVLAGPPVAESLRPWASKGERFGEARWSLPIEQDEDEPVIESPAGYALETVDGYDLETVDGYSLESRDA